MGSRLVEYEECPICGELIPDYPFSDDRCDKCIQEAAMKEWDAELGEYVDQADDNEEPDAKIKIKVTGAAAKALLKELVPAIRKKKVKKDNSA